MEFTYWFMEFTYRFMEFTYRFMEFAYRVMEVNKFHYKFVIISFFVCLKFMQLKNLLIFKITLTDNH